jgi:carboxyl-terminal processing protease
VDPMSGRSELASVVPGTPAERAGMKPGDLIVSVDGKLCKGESSHGALDSLRGPVGQNLTVQVLRGDKLIPVVLQREVIAIDDVSHRVFDKDIGYVAVHSFSARTRGNLQTAMEQVAQKQPKGLVLDLRDNMGGGFDDALAVAEQFIPAGEPMMIVLRRGGKKEILLSKGAPRMASLPLVVLVNHETSAAAEVLAAALQEKRRARVVGVPTLGKWNIQDVKDLPNGYAFKFTTAVLQTPGGKRYEGTGLMPDVQVDMNDDQMARARDTQDAAARLALDPQLRTAVSMFDIRP